MARNDKAYQFSMIFHDLKVSKYPFNPRFDLILQGGEAMSLKETVESVDDENKIIIFKVLEGEITKHFKIFKSHLQVKAKDQGSLVKWTIEYEKVNEDVPNPDAYLEFAVNVTKDIESHHLKA